MKLWKDTYPITTSNALCTDCKIAVMNRQPLIQFPMPIPNKAHQWISIDLVKNSCAQSSDRISGADAYMLTFVDIDEKFFWIMSMNKKDASHIIKALDAYISQKGAFNRIRADAGTDFFLTNSNNGASKMKSK